MLVELAVGDAYGAGFEYVDEEMVRTQNWGTRYVQHPRHNVEPGRYTDDTQMSLAIAEALVAGASWTTDHLAGRFVEVFKRDPRPGYSRRLYPFLQEVASGAELLLKINRDSDRSGAAMRAPPLGVLPSVDAVRERCRVQAAVTHNTAAAIHAATAAALMTHYFLYRRGPVHEVGRFLESLVPGRWSVAWRGKVGAQGEMSVRAGVTAVMRNRRLNDLLRDCIAFTGDVDTVAAIALAAAAGSEEYEQDLPAELVQALENGPYGRDYLAALDRQLLAICAYPKTGGAAGRAQANGGNLAETSGQEKDVS
jgi:ADP-ribosylglycohydrolase